MSAGETITYGSTGPAASAFGHVRLSKRDVAETVAQLKVAIVANGLWVLHEIDPQAILARLHHPIAPARQILFFHPDLMVRLLQADPAALLEVPLKFAVMALSDGTVTVRWIDPAASFVRYDNPALATLGQELAASCERIADQALRGE